MYVLRPERGGQDKVTFKEWRIRRKTARALKRAMHGMTLNSIGPIYGCHRKTGESNWKYERRILKAHMTSDKLWLVKDAKVSVEVKPNE